MSSNPAARWSGYSETGERYFERVVAAGFVPVGRLYSVIFEVWEDEEGEIMHLVTLWKSIREAIRLYEEHS